MQTSDASPKNRSAAADWLRALEFTAKATAKPERIFGAVLDELAAAHGDRPALIAREETLSFAELAARANRYARWALANGVAKGDCVALLMPNAPDYLAVWAGVSHVGGVVALINANLTGAALAHCLDIVAPSHVIVGEGLTNAYLSCTSHRKAVSTLWLHGNASDSIPSVSDAAAMLSGDQLTAGERRVVTLADRALYIYTSGTTGLPKAANVSHRRVIEWSYWFAGLLDTKADDRIYDCLPMYHSVGGVVAIGSVLVNGGSAVIREKFSTSQFWNDVAETGCTLFQYIGELCRYLLRAPAHEQDMTHRLRACCGNGMRADVWTQFQERFGVPRILEFYAATEGSFSLYNVEGHPGAVGKLPGYMAHRAPLAIVQHDPATGLPRRDDNGRCVPCADGEAGEALGRLPSTAKPDSQRFEGYTSAAESDRKVLRDVLKPGDCWFRTGDLMKRDAGGFYYFVDRLGDTFRWKGENVSTTEVENALLGCPGIVQATVYGVAVPGEDGRAGMAAIVTDDRFDLAALENHVAAQLPPYARPLFLRLSDGLAITETFKQKKQQLCEEGYDAARVADPLFKLDAKSGAYLPIDGDQARFASAV